MRIGKREIEVLKLLEKHRLNWSNFVEAVYRKGLNAEIVERIADKQLIVLSGYAVGLSSRGRLALEKAKMYPGRKFIELED